MKRIAAVSLAALLAGCMDIAFGPSMDSDWDFEMCPGGCLDITPAPINILVADTARLRAFSMSGHDNPTWALTGEGAAFLVADTLARAIAAPSSSAVLKGLTPGLVEISATSGQLTARARVRIADSSAITRMEQSAPRDMAVETGSAIQLVAYLYDATGNHFRGQPVWTSSDTSVVVLAVKPDEYLGPHTVAFARKAGTAVLTAKFLGLTSTTRVTVK